MSYFYLSDAGPIESTAKGDYGSPISQAEYESLIDLLPNYPAFRHAIAQLSAWRSLIAADGRATELSRCLGEQDLDTATIWWDDLVNAGKISPELKADILSAAIAANMPQALLDKLQ